MKFCELHTISGTLTDFYFGILRVLVVSISVTLVRFKAYIT
jgi:hypothetical protein